MRIRQLREIFLAACLLSALPAVAQDQPGTAQTYQAVAGDALFEAKCRRCHGAADLAEQYFAPDGAGSEAFIRKLRSHGGTDEAGDRDIAAFLMDLGEGSSTETEASAQ